MEPKQISKVQTIRSFGRCNAIFPSSCVCASLCRFSCMSSLSLCRPYRMGCLESSHQRRPPRGTPESQISDNNEVMSSRQSRMEYRACCASTVVPTLSRWDKQGTCRQALWSPNGPYDRERPPLTMAGWLKAGWRDQWSVQIIPTHL
jgi:hypothetical protein